MRIPTCNFRQEQPLTQRTGLAASPRFPRERFPEKAEQYRTTANRTPWNTGFQPCCGKLLMWSLISRICSQLIQYVQAGQNSYFAIWPFQAFVSLKCSYKSKCVSMKPLPLPKNLILPWLSPHLSINYENQQKGKVLFMQWTAFEYIEPTWHTNSKIFLNFISSAQLLY